jgi:hypothetical protein
LGEADADAITVFEIEQDMQEHSENLLQKLKRGKEVWTPLFEPESYWKESSLHDLASNVLSKRNLKYMGKRVTRLRQEFELRAEQLRSQDDEALNDALAKTSKLSNHVRSRGTKLASDGHTVSPNEYKEPTSLAARRASKTRGPLTLAEKIDVVRMVKF